MVLRSGKQIFQHDLSGEVAIRIDGLPRGLLPFGLVRGPIQDACLARRARSRIANVRNSQAVRIANGNNRLPFGGYPFLPIGVLELDHGSVVRVAVDVAR